MVFEEGYATAPTCAPARAGLMTGRVQNRYGFETQVMEFYPSNYVEYISGRWLVDTGEFVVKAKPSFPSAWQVHKQGVPPSEIMLSEILKKYNYEHRPHRQMAPRRAPRAGSDRLEASTTSLAFTVRSRSTPRKENWSGVINHEHKSFSAQHQWKTGRKDQAAIHAQRQRDRSKRKYLTYAFRDEIMTYMEEHKDRALLHLQCVLRPTRARFRHRSSTTASTRMSKTRTSASTTR